MVGGLASAASPEPCLPALATCFNKFAGASTCRCKIDDLFQNGKRPEKQNKRKKFKLRKEKRVNKKIGKYKKTKKDNKIYWIRNALGPSSLLCN